MIKIFTMKHLNAFRMIKCNPVHLPSTALNNQQYCQSLVSTLHRSMFTFSRHIKKTPTIKSSYLVSGSFSRHYIDVRLGSSIEQKNMSTRIPMDSDILIKAYCTHEELDECVALQKLVWKQSSLEIMPRRSFLIAINTGGIVLGAYRYRNGLPVLLGFTVSFAGILPDKNSSVYWHAEMMGVHPDERDQYIGQRLLIALRECALSRNIKLIKYNFDPTEVRNAHMYIRRVGSIGRRYSTNHYGLFSSSGSTSPFAGRLHMECWLDSLRTRQGLGLKIANEYVISRPKIMDKVIIPANMGEWKRMGDVRAIQAYKVIDEKLIAAFNRQRIIVGFHIELDGTAVYEFGTIDANEL